MPFFWNSFLKTLKNNKVCIVILFMECCVLLLMTANCLRSRCDYTFMADDLYTPSGLGDWITDENGSGYQVYSTEYLGDNILVNTDFFVLYPGSYTVKVVYDSQVSYLDETDYTTGTGLLNLNSSNSEWFYQFDGMLLRDGLSSVEQTVQVTSPWKISDFQITLTYSGQGSLTVYSIEITENVMYKYLGLFGVFVFFVLLDLFCYLMFMGSGFAYIKELGILALIIAAACLPFFADWIFVGEDSAFWAARIRLLAEVFSQGSCISPVQSILTDSSGYTALSAYGSLFLYLPAFLFHCGFSLTFVYNFYLCAVSIAACLVMYFCALSVFRKSNPALLASALYTLCAPRLTSILSLASLGETTAMIFFPLVLVGFYQIYTAPSREKIRFTQIVPVVVGMTGILLSYLPVFEMACLVIILSCVFLIRKTIQPTRLIALVKAAALTALLILLSWLLGWTAAGQTLSVENIAWSKGAYLVQIFNSIVNNYQPQTLETSDLAGSVSMSLGFSVTLGLILFLIYIVKKRWGSEGLKQNDVHFAAFCWGMALLFVFLFSVYPVYDFLDFLPEQFLYLLSGRLAPSGWLPFAALFGIFCTCGIADSMELKETFRGVPVILLLCMALTVNTGQIYSDQMRTSSMERLSNNLYENLDQFGATEAYILCLTE